jgi:hypothetical protein
MKDIMPQDWPPLQPPLSTRFLSAQQRSLVEIMREHQFGRIENMPVRAGQPILDRHVKVVRVARFGDESDGTKVARATEFELQLSVRRLFDELAGLDNGTVIKLEFRHGLPFLIEIMAVIAEAKVPNLLMAPESDHRDHDG